MKKFLAIALIAASFVACNEGEKTEETTVTSDTTTVVTPVAADTATVITDTTVTVSTDTTKKN
jgi:hypothetical protein